MAASPSLAAIPARPFSPVRMVERVVILAIAIAFILTAYSKMGGQAEAAVAKADLAAIKPLLHAYAVEHGGYSGMTIRSLQRYYDPGLDTGAYTLYEQGPAAFCVETTFARKTWHLSADQTDPVTGGCESS